MGPVFRFGRNPTLRLLLSRKIADVGIRAIACSYCHKPSTALGHFGTKFGLLNHSANPIGASAGLAKHGRGRWAFFDRDFNLNLQRATMTHVLGQLCPVVVALVWGSQMSTLLRRLAGVTDTIAYLNARIRELVQARDLVRKARLSARRVRRKSRGRRRAF